MRASDLRAIARSGLQGRWTKAVIAGLLAVLLGAISSGGPTLEFKFDQGRLGFGTSLSEQPILAHPGQITQEMIHVFLGILIFFLVFCLIFIAISIFLGSIIHLGYAKFNLDLVDRQVEPGLNTLFGYFPHWKTAVAASLLQTLYILLWSLLLIIPGIIASYNYAMTSYILAENPWLSASDAIAQSKQMMHGNRFRFFCLQLSFIGWELLALLSCGIGNLWLLPYRQAAYAAFYRDVSGALHRPTHPIF